MNTAKAKLWKLESLRLYILGGIVVSAAGAVFCRVRWSSSHLAVLLGSGRQGSAVASDSPVTSSSPRNSHIGSGTHPRVQGHLGTWSLQLLEIKGTTVHWELEWITKLLLV